MKNDADQGMRIPRDVYIQVQHDLKQKYVEKFGDESVTGAMQQYSRQELVDKYTQNLMFWKQYLPELNPNMSIQSLAQHALCSNAIKQLNSRCYDLEILESVTDAISAKMS
jgi:uncharacterized protein YqeY